MSFITFETIFMSLERGFNARLVAVQTQKEQLDTLKSEHSRISLAIENPSADLQSTRAVLMKQLEEIEKSAKSELEDFDKGGT